MYKGHDIYTYKKEVGKFVALLHYSPCTVLVTEFMKAEVINELF